jgi:glutaconate CoA-transferase subunit B
MSVGDTRAFRKACFAKGLCAAFELTQRGYADYAFIGGAQVDQYGNVCSTYEGGDYLRPRVRFPGSGGAGAMAANCEKTIAIMALEKRRFVKKVDFITSVGFGDGSPDYREKAGVLGSGPYRVITNVALFGFCPDTRRMMLLEYLPGKSPEAIQEMVDFELVMAPDVKPMALPTEEDRSVPEEEGCREISNLAFYCLTDTGRACLSRCFFMPCGWAIKARTFRRRTAGTTST